MYADITPRNWKWMFPAMLSIVLLVAASALMTFGNDLYAYAAIGFALIMGISAGSNYMAYFRKLAVDDYERKRQAEVTTTDVMLLQMARGVHPETYKLVVGRRDLVWMLKQSTNYEAMRPYSVLYACQQVTEYFLVYFLTESTPQQGLSKRRLSEGSFRFDPQHITSDYDQWDGLTGLLRSEGMLTDPNGNQTGLWIAPWEPRTVGRVFGIDLVFDEQEKKYVFAEGE